MSKGGYFIYLATDLRMRTVSWVEELYICVICSNRVERMQLESNKEQKKGKI